MITVYFDMDGVLTDFEEFIAKRAGVQRKELKDPTFRAELIKSSMDHDPTSHWRDIPPNRIREFQEEMSWLRLAGITVEILTSYGLSTMSDCGSLAHTEKVKWLMTHYKEEMENGTISRFNGVQNCWQKQHFATPTSILIDDQEENVDQWHLAGGRAILYDLENHDEGMEGFLRVLREMC